MWARVRHLLLRAGWAPVLTVVLHQMLGEWNRPLLKSLDFWMHFTGGVAIAYFLHHAQLAFPGWLKTASRLGDALFTFALALTIGVIWELGEYASDMFLGTKIQRTAPGILNDLIADICGSALLVAAVHLAAVFRKVR